VNHLKAQACVPAFVLLLSGPGILRADTVHGPALVVADTPTEFAAIGTLTSVDTDAPPNGVSEWLEVLGNNWRFKIRHSQGAPPYDPPRGAGNPGGFNQVDIAIEGGGLPPPAPVNRFGHTTAAGPHAGETPNNIPLTGSANPADVAFGRAGALLTIQDNVDHPPNKHRDFYQMRTRVMALAGAFPAPPGLPGPPNLLSGAFQVRAAHRAELPAQFSFPRDGQISSTAEGGSSVSFDASTGTLKFSIGFINGLTMQAGTPGTVEKSYREDPILEARWVATPIKLVEKKDAVYRFGPGVVFIGDRQGAVRLKATFADFIIVDSTSLQPLKSFGVLEHMSIREEDGPRRSAFLDDFISRNLFAEDVPEAVWAHWNGIDFAVVTQADLVALTEKFTVSAFDVPATYILVANYDEAIEEQ
jgi:hypothetical protein